MAVVKLKSVKELLLYNKESPSSVDSPESQTFFEKMLNANLDKYNNIGLTPEEANDFKQVLFLMKFGSGVFTPLICRAPLCSFSALCPLQKAGKAPEGAHCPLELAQIMNRSSYWSSVLSTNGCDLTNPLYEHYVNRLTYLDILLQRCSWAEACGYQEVIIETVAKVGRGGEAMKQIMENPILTISEKLMRVQSVIMTDLVITPKETYKRKVAMKVKDDSSDFAILQLKKRMALKEAFEGEEVLVAIPEHLRDAKEE